MFPELSYVWLLKLLLILRLLFIFLCAITVTDADIYIDTQPVMILYLTLI